jgi:hypothetical protein
MDTMPGDTTSDRSLISADLIQREAELLYSAGIFDTIEDAEDALAPQD